jgi:hypothetical protein
MLTAFSGIALSGHAPPASSCPSSSPPLSHRPSALSVCPLYVGCGNDNVVQCCFAAAAAAAAVADVAWVSCRLLMEATACCSARPTSRVEGQRCLPQPPCLVAALSRSPVALLNLSVHRCPPLPPSSSLRTSSAASIVCVSLPLPSVVRAAVGSLKQKQ